MTQCSVEPVSTLPAVAPQFFLEDLFFLLISSVLTFLRVLGEFSIVHNSWLNSPTLEVLLS